MELINAIEISPDDYSINEYAWPEATSAAEPLAWNTYWLKCISDSGLGNLKPVRNGSYLVAIDTIAIEELSIILNKALSDIDLEDYEEQVGKLCGGVVIKINNNPIIEPSCCGDLGNLSEWENIFSSEPNGWR